LCGVIANCDDWPDIVQFAQQRETWFRRFLRLPGGIPSHDTFERVFAALNPRALEACCLAWLRDVAGLAGVEHIAIDGKSLRGSASLRVCVFQNGMTRSRPSPNHSPQRAQRTQRKTKASRDKDLPAGGGYGAFQHSALIGFSSNSF